MYCYTLGKEEIFVNLARDFNTKVKITKDWWNRLHVIGMAEKYFETYDDIESREKPANNPMSKNVQY